MRSVMRLGRNWGTENVSRCFRLLSPPPYHGTVRHNADIPARSQRREDDAMPGVRTCLHICRRRPRKIRRGLLPMERAGSSIVPKVNKYQHIRDTTGYTGPLVPYHGPVAPYGSYHRCRYCIWRHMTHMPRCNPDTVSSTVGFHDASATSFI